MATQTATKEKSHSSKHSRKRTHDESTLASSQATRSDSPTKKARTLGHVKLQSSLKPSKDTQKPSQESTSPFATVRAAFYLTLSPITSTKGLALAGLCLEHLSPLLLTYYAPLKGVVLAYSNVVLSSTPPAGNSARQIEAPMAMAVDEGAAPHVWLAADFTLLEPRKGVRLQGYASVVTQSHVGLICYNLFNASIPARHLPRGWSWQASGQEDDASHGGHWVDEQGETACTADSDSPTQLEFRVRDFDSGSGAQQGVGARDRGYLTLEGTLLSEADEAEVVESERKQQQQSSSLKQSHRGKQHQQQEKANTSNKKKKKQKSRSETDGAQDDGDDY